MKTLMQLMEEAAVQAQAGFMEVARAGELRAQSERLEARKVQADEYVAAYEGAEASARAQLNGSQLALRLWRTEFRLLVAARHEARAVAEQLEFLRELVESETAVAAHRRARAAQGEVHA